MTSYTATTSNATNSVTATPADTNASVALKLGGEVTSSPVTWSVGENNLAIEVTNGTVKKTYSVVVTKS